MNKDLIKLKSARIEKGRHLEFLFSIDNYDDATKVFDDLGLSVDNFIMLSYKNIEMSSLIYKIEITGSRIDIYSNSRSSISEGKILEFFKNARIDRIIGKKDTEYSKYKSMRTNL
jgi:hypothetical protein